MNNNLTEEEEILIYNALCIADRYTHALPDNSPVKRAVAVAIKIAIKRGFPYTKDVPNE